MTPFGPSEMDGTGIALVVLMLNRLNLVNKEVGPGLGAGEATEDDGEVGVGGAESSV